MVHRTWTAGIWDEERRQTQHMEEDKGHMTQDECKVTYTGKERQEQEKDMENMEVANADENMEESKEERTSRGVSCYT